MTIESRIFVRIPDAATSFVLDLATRANSSLARAEKLPPGDRTEALRFEALHAAIDQLAVASMANGASYKTLSDPGGDGVAGLSVFGPGSKNLDTTPEWVREWVQEGSMVVELRLPHFPGPTGTGGVPGSGPPETAERWVSTTKAPKEAVRERFFYLLGKAIKSNKVGDAVLRPSGVANSILTEGLREFAQRRPAQERVDVPVIYRDGSKGPHFPLLSLSMTDSIPEGWRTYRFALMSIRHVEMDTVVDGAWLRNIKISRTREAGLTDQIVFETSLRQVRRLTSTGPTLIHMYQTGLETAIVGFYRSIVHHLIDEPGSIVVVPWYFQKRGDFREGTVWATS